VQVRDRVFVITGAGNGMAREIALQLLAKGASVAGVDLDAAGLEETARLAGAGDRFASWTLSIADRAAVEALPAQVAARLGPVDGVLNVAGIIHPFLHIDDLTIEQIERVVDVNFWGTVYVTKAFLPGLLERPEAYLLNFSSMGGLAPVPGQGAYGASKAAVKLFTETLFAELHETNVHVTEVFPGGVATNIAGNSGLDLSKLMADVDPKKAAKASGASMTTPQDAARIVLEAIERNEFRVLIGSDAKGLDRLSRLTPTQAILTVANKMKALLG